MNRRGITRATRPTPEQDAEIVRLYRPEGYGIQTIAEQTGLSLSRVWETLQRKKVRMRSRGYRHPPPWLGVARRLYRKGASLSTAAEAVGMTSNILAYQLKKAGVVLRKVGRPRKDASARRRQAGSPCRESWA